MFSWNFHNTQSMILKVSIGYYCGPQSNFMKNPYFANLTFGKRLIDFNENQPNYFFTEIESGIYSGYIISGIGLGAAYYKSNNKLMIVPKASIFTGDGIFLRSDLILCNKRIDADLGGMLVVPLCPQLLSVFKGVGPILPSTIY